MNKALLLHVKVERWSGGKAFQPLFELGAEQAVFIIGHTF